MKTIRALKRGAALATLISLMAPIVVFADALPQRDGPIPPTTKGIPH